MPNSAFEDVVCKMPKYLDGSNELKGLKDCQPFTPDERGNLRRDGKPLPEVEGIYCFYEGDKALYVGRTDNIRKRVLQQRRPGGRHNSAAFAFNIAKKDLEKNHPDEDVGGLSRGELSKNPTFDHLFTKAKDRVRKMSVRFVEIKDPIEQAIFEVYAHIKLGTPPRFNDFGNH